MGLVGRGSYQDGLFGLKSLIMNPKKGLLRDYRGTIAHPGMRSCGDIFLRAGPGYKGLGSFFFFWGGGGEGSPEFTVCVLIFFAA